LGPLHNNKAAALVSLAAAESTRPATRWEQFLVMSGATRPPSSTMLWDSRALSRRWASTCLWRPAFALVCGVTNHTSIAHHSKHQLVRMQPGCNMMPNCSPLGAQPGREQDDARHWLVISTRCHCIFKGLATSPRIFLETPCVPLRCRPRTCFLLF
jgi:hypothetical protein